MLRNILSCLAGVIFLASNAHAHSQYLHQYAVREAYKLLEKQILGDVPTLKGYIGTSETAGPWTTSKVVAGAWREDEEDVVWGYCSSQPPYTEGLGGSQFTAFVGSFIKDPFICVTHFWDPDAGDATDTRLEGYFTYVVNFPFLIVAQNAYRKMTEYRTGFCITFNGWRSIVDVNGDTWKFFSLSGPSGSPTEVDFYCSLAGIVDLYKTGKIYTGNQISKNITQDYTRPSNTIIYLNQAYRNKIVFEMLGRMAHLMVDMSVPSHAHQDAHCDEPDQPGIHVDTYETWFADAGNYYWNADNIYLRDGNNSVLNPYGHSPDPLHYLMYTTSQIAGYFGSNGPYSGDGNSMIGGGYSSDEYNFVNPTISGFATNIDGYDIRNMRTNDNEYTTNIKGYIRDNTLPQAIKAVAGLFYWFGCETGMMYTDPQEICIRTELDGIPYVYTIGQVGVEGNNYQSPYLYYNYVNAPFTISAVPVIVYNGEYYYFDNWSDGGAQSHDVYVPLSGIVSTEKSSYDAVFTAYYKKIPPITIQNKIWDSGVTNTGTVVVDGVSYPSPYTVKWVPGSTHTIATSVSGFTYNSKDYYYVSWTDDPNWAHTIIAPNTATTYSACYKPKPVLTGTYDAYATKSYLSISGWDSRPPNSNFWPKHWEKVAIWQWINIYSSTYPYPNTAITYTHPISFVVVDGQYDNVFVWNVNSSIYSNILAIQKGIVGDPIVASSSTEEATAFSNGKKLVIDSKGKLHAVFVSNDSVCYATSVDEGETWTVPSPIGKGKNPAIELSDNQTPSLCWSNGNNLYYADSPNNAVWSAPNCIYTGPEGTEVTYLSYVLDQKTNQSYMGWVDNGPAGATAYVSPYNSSSSSSLAPSPIGSGSTDAFKSPSLALDNKGNLKVAWSHNSKLYYYDENGTVELGEGGIHPIVDTYGEKTNVVWQEETETGKYRIVKKVKTRDGWGDNQVISWADSGDAQYPMVAAAGQYAFTKENGNGDYDIYYLGEYENGNYITTQNISGASEGQSNYPSITFRQSWPNHKLYFLWTEKAEKNSKAIIKVKLVVKDLIPVPSWGVYPNIDYASFYTVQREGAFNYGTCQYATVDYHPTKLKYHFVGLDPYKRYKAKVVYYRNVGGEADNPSSDWLEQLKVDNVSLNLSHVPDNTIVTEEVLIPNNCYKDGIIDVAVDKIKGDYAICAMLEINEYEGDGKYHGGAQSEEITSITINYINKLYQNCPNPFSHKTNFMYQIKNQGQVTFKVYNALGQLVRTLVNESKPAGAYQVVWDGKDGCGLKVSSGVYIYRMQTGGFMETKKMVVIK